MLDKVRLAVAEGCRVALVYCMRSRELVKLEPIEGCDIFPISVSHRGVELSRFLHLPRLVWWLRRNLFKQTETGCHVQSDSLDMLALAQLASVGKRARFHHMVRDLHSLQLGNGLKSKLVRWADRLLLKRIAMLVLTCPGYYERYYSEFYDGKVTVIENWPDPEVWQGFKRCATDELTIGFVGVIRYLDCLKTLIRAIDQLCAHGHKVKLKLAGGGEIEQVLEETGPREWIQYSGAFSYREEIQELYSDVDIIWSVYDARIKNVRYALPNKFYESILSGIPIIVAEGTYLADRVHEFGIGTSIPGLDHIRIAQALEQALAKSSWYRTAEVNLPACKDQAMTYLENEHRDRIRQGVMGESTIQATEQSAAA